MKAVFFDATVWRYVITGVSKVIKEGVFKATDEGLRLKAMDPSHVIMIDLLFPPESFEEYEAEGESLGVNLEELGKILRRARSEDRLELRSMEGALEIVLSGRFPRKFREPLLQIEEEELGEPKIPFKADARMVADQFREAIKDIEPLGDTVTFQAMEGKLLIMNESELGQAVVELDVESGSLISIETEGEQKSSYGLDYIENLLPATQKAEMTRIQFSSEMPCKITFELPQGARLVAYIAPRTV